MRGRYDLVIEDNKVRYEFVLDRKVTIIKGTSGTGKTTLYERVLELVTKSADIAIKCNRRSSLYALFDKNYSSILRTLHDKLIFIDEEYEPLNTFDFAREVTKSDNYFVIITRKKLPSTLTYSVDSIFELDSARHGRITVTKLINKYRSDKVNIVPDVVLCEDSNSGKQMLENVLSCPVESAGGNGQIGKELDKYTDKVVYIVADGAAFGCCISKIMIYLDVYDNFYLFLPESFEYMMLLYPELYRYYKDEIDNVPDYCDVVQYFSWEGYYTDLLRLAAKIRFRVDYLKSRLNKYFLQSKFKEHIKGLLCDLDESCFK